MLKGKFIEGETFTHLEQTYNDDLQPKQLNQEELALAVAAHLLGNISATQKTQHIESAWDRLVGFRL